MRFLLPFQNGAIITLLCQGIFVCIGDAVMDLVGLIAGCLECIIAGEFQLSFNMPELLRKLIEAFFSYC